MKNTKKILLSALFVILPFCASNAQKASYSYKPFSDKGCEVRLYVSKQDSAYYLVAVVRSDILRFLKQPTMQIKTFKDNNIKLYGENIGESSTDYGIMVGNIFLPVNKINSTAQFYIKAEQLELLKEGIKKIRFSTIPCDHEKSFGKDKIGKRLYKQYINQRDANHEF